MRALRTSIYNAQQNVSEALSSDFDAKVTVESLQQSLRELTLADIDMGANHIIKTLFDGRGILDANHGLIDLEEKCFRDCIRLLREADEKTTEKRQKTDADQKVTGGGQKMEADKETTEGRQKKKAKAKGLVSDMPQKRAASEDEPTGPSSRKEKRREGSD